MEKEIHDEKMKRFVQHAVLSNPGSPTKPKREIKRVDTGLGLSRSAYKCDDISVNISPSRKQPGG